MDELFYEWMRLKTKLGDSSCYKYKRAIVTISKLAINEKLINSSLYKFSSLEFSEIKKSIYANEEFNIKNTTGNRMYSRALEYYQQFLNQI